MGTRKVTILKFSHRVFLGAHRYTTASDGIWRLAGGRSRAGAATEGKGLKQKIKVCGKSLSVHCLWLMKRKVRAA